MPSPKLEVRISNAPGKKRTRADITFYTPGMTQVVDTATTHPTTKPAAASTPGAAATLREAPKAAQNTKP